MTPTPGPRALLQRWLGHPAWELVLAVFTLTAVFGFPLYTLACPAGLEAPEYTAAVYVLLAVFALDWLARLLAFGRTYLGSFYFWVDALATLSLFAELPSALAALHGGEAGAWPNPRVLRMSVYVTRLSRLARQSRTLLRLRDLLFRRKLDHSASAAEHQATELQHDLELRFNALVAVFVVLGLLFIPLRETFTARDELHEAVRHLAQAPDAVTARAHELVLLSDPRVISLAEAPGQGPARVLAGPARHALAPYEVSRYHEGRYVLTASHREERLAGARLDIVLALFIVAVMVVMSTAFSRATDRVLVTPLRDLQRAVEEAIRRNQALHFLRSVQDTEPVTFLRRVFIPLLERLVAAVNVEARESILRSDAAPLSRSRDWAIAFTDIQNYTTLMETLGPDGFTAINEYFGHCAGVIAAHQGDIFEHTGDGFIVTLAGEGKEARAFAMAVRIIEELERITATEAWAKLLAHPAWASAELRHVRTRIGIHAGTVTTGRIGTERCCRYGMIGEAANVAARLESLNKQLHTWLLVTDDIAAHAPADLRGRTRRVDRVVVVGAHAPVTLHTYDFSPPADYAGFRKAFDAGLAAYLAGSWREAAGLLDEAAQRWPGDGPTAALRERLGRLGPDAPPGWSGALQLTQK